MRPARHWCAGRGSGSSWARPSSAARSVSWWPRARTPTPRRRWGRWTRDARARPARREPAHGAAGAGGRRCRRRRVLAGARLPARNVVRPRDFAPYSAVERVAVDVMVAGETTRSDTFDVRPPGADSGGVQVNFDTYPAGKHADVAIRLEGASGTLATRNVNVALAGECAAVEVSFGTTDGGAGGRGGAAAGSSAAAALPARARAEFRAALARPARARAARGERRRWSVADAVAARLAPDGSRQHRAAAQGPASPARASPARAVAAAPAAAQERAAAAARAAAQVPGVAGASGRGGGAGAGCMATTENCFNYLDDDCDGTIDCMDPDCNTVGLCVALDPGQGQLGVLLPDAQTPCPPNYTTATTINSGQIRRSARPPAAARHRRRAASPRSTTTRPTPRAWPMRARRWWGRIPRRSPA